MRSNGGITVTGDIQSNSIRTCSSATLSTTNSTLTDLVSKPGLCGESPTCLGYASFFSQVAGQGLIRDSNSRNGIGSYLTS